MAKRFLTARDIDDYANLGIFSIEVGDDLVITDVGRERARERGVKLIPLPVGTKTPSSPNCDATPRDKVREQVRAAVISKLGSTPDNLDVIISNVLNSKK